MLLCPLTVTRAATDIYSAQLTGPEPELYATIVSYLQGRTASFTHTFSPAREYDSPAAQKTVSDAVFRAYEAFYREHPEVFWVSKSGRITVTLDGTTSGTKTKVNAVKIDTVFTRPADIPARQQALDKEAAAILAKAAGSDYDKVKAFHNEIVQRCAYDLNAKSNPSGFPDAFEAYGALVDGKAVCEGYSKAFKLLCDRAGIPCVIVGGMAEQQPHMWNYVKLGGAYYLVDATFDDPVGGTPNEALFLKGAETTKDHLPGDGFLQDFKSGFTDPVLSPKDYVPGVNGASASGSAVKNICTVRYSGTAGGRFAVMYAGINQPLDQGQSVFNGMNLYVETRPDTGYTVQSVEARMGESTLRGTGDSLFYFEVTDDCKITVTFTKTA